MSRIACSSRSSANARAACMARVFATTMAALCLVGSPNSASAIALADAVRFSIFDEAADSDRSRSGAYGAMSAPSSASSRAISAEASSARARASVPSRMSRRAISGGTAAWYGPECAARRLRGIWRSSGSVHGTGSYARAGHGGASRVRASWVSGFCRGH
jgi:hypothetical protein